MSYVVHTGILKDDHEWLARRDHTDQADDAGVHELRHDGSLTQELLAIESQSLQ